MGYTKLFTEIVASSIWDEDDKTRLVWITLLALKDRTHFVRGTPRYLALAARVSQEDCDKALVRLAEPDPSSRTPDNDGRRIRAAAGGWEILNGEKYSKMLSRDDRAEYHKLKQREYRAKAKAAPVRVGGGGTTQERVAVGYEKKGEPEMAERVAGMNGERFGVGDKSAPVKIQGPALPTKPITPSSSSTDPGLAAAGFAAIHDAPERPSVPVSGAGDSRKSRLDPGLLPGPEFL